MTKVPPGPKELVAFKIGARARKFLIEGCPIEGFEVLLTALAESEVNDPPLHALLVVEMTKFEKRVAAADDAED